MSGAEVVQVYVRPLSSSVHRPDRELRAFVKRHLDPAGEASLSFTLPPRAFAYYDTLASDWYAPSRRVAASLTWGCSLPCMELQPPSHGVAASLA